MVAGLELPPHTRRRVQATSENWKAEVERLSDGYGLFRSRLMVRANDTLSCGRKQKVK